MPNAGAIAVSNPVLTPPEVAALVSMPREQVRVQGVVTSVFHRPGMTVAYGQIEYGEGAVGFTLPADQIPAEHSAIVIHGTLSFRYNKNLHDYRYQPHITGRIVGTFEPSVAGIDIELVRHTPRKDLRDWFTLKALYETAVDRPEPVLLVLCTKTAERDIRQAIEGHKLPVHVKFEEIKFHPAEQTARMIQAKDREIAPDMIAIARGGGAGHEIGRSANSPAVVKALLDTEVPFYSAVGHEHDITLLDKFSDESFHTPTALGSALATLSDRYEREVAASISMHNVARENERLRRRMRWQAKLVAVLGAVALVVAGLKLLEW